MPAATCSLFQRIEMVRQRHALQYLYDLGRSDDIAEPESRHRPGLRISADDCERHPLADKLEGRPFSELAVSLVDYHQGAGLFAQRCVEDR